jgi:perosamine synthetase
MHIFDHPVDFDGVLSVASDFNLALVEDAAESLGSYYRGQHTGTFGKLGTLSFNRNKMITTGGGGPILTNEAEPAVRARHLTTTAKVPQAWEYWHDEVGYNYRMPNLNAALGCAHLEKLPDMPSSNRALFERYHAAFSHVPGVELGKEPEQCRSNYWLQSLLLDEAQSHQRDLILKATNNACLMMRPVWTLMHELTPFEGCQRIDLSGAISRERRLINIPSNAGLVPVGP